MKLASSANCAHWTAALQCIVAELRENRLVELALGHSAQYAVNYYTALRLHSIIVSCTSLRRINLHTRHVTTQALTVLLSSAAAAAVAITTNYNNNNSNNNNKYQECYAVPHVTSTQNSHNLLNQTLIVNIIAGLTVMESKAVGAGLSSFNITPLPSQHKSKYLSQRSQQEQGLSLYKNNANSCKEAKHSNQNERISIKRQERLQSIYNNNNKYYEEEFSSNRPLHPPRRNAISAPVRISRQSRKNSCNADYNVDNKCNNNNNCKNNNNKKDNNNNSFINSESKELEMANGGVMWRLSPVHASHISDKEVEKQKEEREQVTSSRTRSHFSQNSTPELCTRASSGNNKVSVGYNRNNYNIRTNRHYCYANHQKYFNVQREHVSKETSNTKCITPDSPKHACREANKMPPFTPIQSGRLQHHDNVEHVLQPIRRVKLMLELQQLSAVSAAYILDGLRKGTRITSFHLQLHTMSQETRSAVRYIQCHLNHILESNKRQVLHEEKSSNTNTNNTNKTNNINNNNNNNNNCRRTSMIDDSNLHAVNVQCRKAERLLRINSNSNNSNNNNNCNSISSRNGSNQNVLHQLNEFNNEITFNAKMEKEQPSYSERYLRERESARTKKPSDCIYKPSSSSSSITLSWSKACVISPSSIATFQLKSTREMRKNISNVNVDKERHTSTCTSNEVVRVPHTPVTSPRFAIARVGYGARINQEHRNKSNQTLESPKESGKLLTCPHTPSPRGGALQHHAARSQHTQHKTTLAPKSISTHERREDQFIGNRQGNVTLQSNNDNYHDLCEGRDSTPSPSPRPPPSSLRSREITCATLQPEQLTIRTKLHKRYNAAESQAKVLTHNDLPYQQEGSNISSSRISQARHIAEHVPFTPRLNETQEKEEQKEEEYDNNNNNNNNEHYAANIRRYSVLHEHQNGNVSHFNNVPISEHKVNDNNVNHNNYTSKEQESVLECSSSSSSSSQAGQSSMVAVASESLSSARSQPSIIVSNDQCSLPSYSREELETATSMDDIFITGLCIDAKKQTTPEPTCKPPSSCSSVFTPFSSNALHLSLHEQKVVSSSEEINDVRNAVSETSTRNGITPVNEHNAPSQSPVNLMISPSIQVLLPVADHTHLETSQRNITTPHETITHSKLHVLPKLAAMQRHTFEECDATLNILCSNQQIKQKQSSHQSETEHKSNYRTNKCKEENNATGKKEKHVHSHKSHPLLEEESLSSQQLLNYTNTSSVAAMSRKKRSISKSNIRKKANSEHNTKTETKQMMHSVDTMYTTSAKPLRNESKHNNQNNTNSEKNVTKELKSLIKEAANAEKREICEEQSLNQVKGNEEVEMSKTANFERTFSLGNVTISASPSPSPTPPPLSQSAIVTAITQESEEKVHLEQTPTLSLITASNIVKNVDMKKESENNCNHNNNNNNDDYNNNINNNDKREERAMKKNNIDNNIKEYIVTQHAISYIHECVSDINNTLSEYQVNTAEQVQRVVEYVENWNANLSHTITLQLSEIMMVLADIQKSAHTP